MAEDYDFLFAKSKLPFDTIDLGIGENFILQKAVVEAYDLKNISFDLPHIFEYAPPNGYGPLVEKLESMYGGKIVVTQSAKHALSCCFYALKASGRNKIHFKSPYWPSIPALITREGLDYSHLIDDCDSELVVSPNNPDGHSSFISSIENVPVIHDAAYYTHSYLSDQYGLSSFGDMQIFSVAKMYGLSGIRLGFILVNNDKYYDYLTKFVEATTAGVSTASQRILLKILDQEEKDPQIRVEYENSVRAQLHENRNYLLLNLDERKFEISTHDKQFQKGMFAWIKSKYQDFSSVGVNIMGGKAFGDPDYIRINLAVQQNKIISAVRKMNYIK